MRAIFFGLLLCLSTTAARAQEQERKLVDRILKPDMTLENSAQNKQFAVGGTSAPAKRLRLPLFSFLQRSPAKAYGGVRNFETKKFQARNSAEQNRAANLPARSVRDTNKAYSTAEYSRVRAASDAHKSVYVAEVNDSNREFLVHGKSQKALSAQDRPLTIDDVRDLLNKNK
jgi:hypothetical protein